jgi:hypothetical protein
MKKEILTVGVLFLIQSIYCQSDSIGNWLADMSGGIEAHDKRLFDYSEKESLLEMQPEFWGTYHIAFNVNRKFWQSKNIHCLIGLGVSYEKATFLRPFNHFHFNQDSFYILRNLNKYEKLQVPLSVCVFYELGNTLIISGRLKSNVLIFRSIDHTENNSDAFPYTEGTFELDDIQLRLGLSGRIGKIIIGLHSRIVNFQKIDRIIFNDIIKDPRTDQTWEWHNPLRFDLTVGYTW